MSKLSKRILFGFLTALTLVFGSLIAFSFDDDNGSTRKDIGTIENVTDKGYQIRTEHSKEVFNYAYTANTAFNTVAGNKYEVLIKDDAFGWVSPKIIASSACSCR
jgi:hypothetical protein